MVSKLTKPAVYLFVMAIVFMFVRWLAPGGWSGLVNFVNTNPGGGAAIFNAILLLSFIGSIMVSSATVGNSAKMEYLLVAPIRARDIFLEKMIIVIINSSITWLILGIPIFLGLSLESSAPLAILSPVVFAALLLVLVMIGVSTGGLLGLVFAKILAGRRSLKQAGYFLLTALTIVFSGIWYYSFYFSENRYMVTDIFFRIADMIGLSAHTTPGYTVSAISLGVLVGMPFSLSDVLAVIVMCAAGVMLILVNAYVSEVAHYSGWLAHGSKRTSKETKKVIEHKTWAPKNVPLIKANNIVNVSYWFNITNVRREGRVFALYLLGPVRQTIFILMMAIFTAMEEPMISAMLFIMALVPFPIGYGLYFAGYELVFEGKNLMNLQLASANLLDYIRGKIYSAVPFTIGVATLISIILVVIVPTTVIYVPLLLIECIAIAVLSGAISANYAAIGGDFKAERFQVRGRRSVMRPPIHGRNFLKMMGTHFVLGYLGGVIVAVSAIFAGPLIGYAALLGYGLICWLLYRRYLARAGKELLKIEASDYL